jgi:purine-nucleoside phosphorylase
MNEGEQLDLAASRLREAAGGALDVAVVLGSGLADAVIERIENGVKIPYAQLAGAPQSAKRIAGHPGEAAIGTWAGRRVVAFAGRVHLYQGYSGYEVAYFVRLAAAAGVTTLVLTSAAGGLKPGFRVGDLMILSDQINATGASSLDANSPADPFVPMIDAYSPRLREIALRDHAREHVRCGVFAGVRGPAYETPAEARWLRSMGADAVAMSMVLETIAARALGLEVFGVSLIANLLGVGADAKHHDVLAAAQAGSHRLAELIEHVLQNAHSSD